MTAPTGGEGARPAKTGLTPGLPPRPPGGGTDLHRGDVAAALAAAGVLVLMLCALVSGAASADVALRVLSLEMILVGGWIFVVHGRTRITVAGIYALASAIFIGVGGLFWQSQGEVYKSSLVAVVAAGIATALAMWMMFWRRLVVDDRSASRIDPTVARRMAVVALVALVALVASGLPTSPPQSTADAVGEGGVGAALIIALVAFLMSFRRRSLVVYAASAAGILVCVGAYYVISADAYGRLNLVFLAVGGAMVLSAVHPTWITKAGVLAAIVPAIAVLERARESYGMERFGAPVDGTMSIYSPLRYAALILERYRGEPQGVADTLVPSLVAWIPRSLWPDKPETFGFVLDRSFRIVPSGQLDSRVALAQGEWIFSFGVIGLFGMVLGVGLLILVLDRALTTKLSRGIITASSYLGFVTVLILGAGVSELAWGGTGSYTTRILTRVLLLALLVPVAAILDSSRQTWTAKARAL